MAKLFSFPNPVDEHAARTVAGGVVALAVVTFFAGVPALSLVLLYGFAARVLTGPTLSPLGQLATRVVAPRFAAPKLTAGPPKRFAQGIGLAFSLATVLTWLLASWGAARWILLPLIAAAALESFVGYCLGCAIFAQLMRFGVIPESVCADCADISRRYATS
jgi:hypothetical protein